jgi:DNA (cytosine-5)-methyltransferase 1
VITIADLFCGAGGTSDGALDAIRILGHRAQLTAINHWPVAIDTHTANHPEARHLCTSIDEVNPRTLFKEGELDVLWASPECTHHSLARGGKPSNEQSRATAWCVPRWMEAVRPNVVLIENVPEFKKWGPRKNGATFQAWFDACCSMGYKGGVWIARAADYGDPTTRQRLFVQFVRGRRRVVWPDPTHSQSKEADLYTERKPWVPARDIIDWNLPSQSIYERKKPLSPKTMRRIMAGLEKFGLKPFTVRPAHGNDDRTSDSRRAESVEKPLGVVPCSNEFAICEPLILSAGGPECGARPVSEPMGTVLCRDHRALAEPFLVPQNSSNAPRSVDKPAPTVTCTSRGVGLAEPYLICMEHGGTERDINRPMPTVTTAKGGAIGVAHPFMVKLRGTNDAASLDQPSPTVTATGTHLGLAEPFLIHTAHQGDRHAASVEQPLGTVTGNRGDLALIEAGVLPQNQGGLLRPVSEPAPTIATDGAIALVKPYLVKYYGAGNGAESVDRPLATVTAQDRFGLVRPTVIIRGERYLLDIKFRMLQPKELAGAQGFRKDYVFTGTKTDQVKQIGNAVPRNLARAIVLAALSQKSDIRQFLAENAVA